MKLFLNDRLVDEAEARVSVLDRGFLYGDGVFETLRVQAGHPFQWGAHLARFERGALALGIPLPRTASELRAIAAQVIEANRQPDGMLRLALSRGVGSRGYSPRGADHPTLALSLHPAPVLSEDGPAGWAVVTVPMAVPGDSELTRHKTANKLLQVLARKAAEEVGADEALLTDVSGQAVEAASANLFWFERGMLCTPPVRSGALPGITRGWVLDWARRAGWAVEERNTTPSGLREAEGVFLTLSSCGLIEVRQLDGRELARSPRLGEIWRSYLAALRAGSD